jgi:hypothetical protein
VLLAALALACWPYWAQLLRDARILGETRPELAVKRLVFYARVILGGGLMLLGILGAILIRVAVRTIQSGRFPPPGMKVLRDTPIITGNGAKLRAILLVAVTFVLVTSQVFLSFCLPKTLEKIVVLHGP